MNNQYQSSIPFDQYQRYGTVARASEHLRIGGQPFKILEVGANTHQLLGHLLPNDHIVYLDREVPEEMRHDENIIIGDATQLAMSDASFDIVIALDVFEHVPSERRGAFLENTTRIARLMTIIAAPFDEPGVRDAEKAANNLWINLFGTPYRWLDEHEQSGLPVLEWTKSELDTLGFNHFALSQGDLGLWTHLMTAHFAKEYVHALRPLVVELDRHYRDVLFDLDFCCRTSYREFLFIARAPEALSGLSRSLTARAPTGRKDDGKILDALLEALPAIALEKATEAKRADVLQSELDSARKLVLEAEAAVRVKEAAIREKETALHQMRRSFSWRATAPLRSLKTWFSTLH